VAELHWCEPDQYPESVDVPNWICPECGAEFHAFEVGSAPLRYGMEKHVKPGTFGWTTHESLR
jgi:hypothetical protein